MDNIFKRARYLRSVGNIKGAEALERFVESRRKAGRYFADDPETKARVASLRVAKIKLERAADD